MRIIIICLLFTAQSVFAQREKTITVMGSADFYFPIQSDESLFCNGYSMFLIKQVGVTRISIGLSYSSFSYYEDILKLSLPSHLIRKRHDLAFFDLPILFSFPHVKQKNFTFHALVGIVFSKQLSYVQTRYYDNSDPKELYGLQNSSMLGISLRTGMQTNYNLNENLTIGLNTFLDTMFKPIFNSSQSNEIERGFVLGLNLFIGYSIF